MFDKAYIYKSSQELYDRWEIFIWALIYNSRNPILKVTLLTLLLTSP